MTRADATFEGAADAVADGDVDALRALLDATPEVVHARSPRAHRATLLHYVAANGVEDERQKAQPNAPAVARLLLDRGADVDALAETYGGGPAQTTLALLVSSGWPADAGVQGELVDVLCDAGANPNGLDDDGVPLATAIAFRCPQAVTALAPRVRIDDAVSAAAVGRLDIVTRDVSPGGVLRDGAPRCRVPWLGVPDDPAGAAGAALVRAAQFDHVDIVEFLLGCGVPADVAPAGDGLTPAHEAAFAGARRALRALLDAGIDPGRRDVRWGTSVLGWAVAGGQTAARELLLSRWQPDVFDAVEYGLNDRLRAWLDAHPGGADGPSGDGVLLHLAARYGNRDGVEILLARGADPTRVDRDGRTPAAIARAAGHDAIADRLT